MLGDAVSSGYDCISRRFSAGLLAVNQGKPTQKCSQRRRKCASGILETRPKCSLLRGAWIDYQKTPSFATNLRLRFISISQPVVAPALEGISPGFTQENMEGDHAVNGALYLSPEHTGAVPRVHPSLQHTGMILRVLLFHIQNKPNLSVRLSGGLGRTRTCGLARRQTLWVCRFGFAELSTPDLKDHASAPSAPHRCERCALPKWLLCMETA